MKLCGRFGESSRCFIIKVSAFTVFLYSFVVCTIESSKQIHEEDFSVINVSGMLIKGKLGTSLSGRQFLSYQGIPYAVPPVGMLRFHPPKPLPPNYLFGIFNATSEGPMCPQYFKDTNEIVGSEDCLYLNVYTHYNVQNVPVIVFLHGGSFSSGHGGMSEYGPDYLMDANLLVVTLNYRLGALGFLSTGSAILPGNYGLKDQLQALRWVNENIEQFGGDVNRITLHGYGAGGASAQYHMLSPVSRGLFHHAIYQGGSALNFWTFEHHPLKITRSVAHILNCPTNSTTTAMVSCISSKPSISLVETLHHFPYWVIKPSHPFLPVQEFQNSTDDPPFLTKLPEKILKKRRYTQIPTIVGTTHSENFELAWNVFSNESLLGEMETYFNRVAGFSMNYFGLTDNILKSVREFYFSNIPIRNATLRQLNHFFSDCKVAQGVYRSAMQQSATSFDPVYFYRFNFKGRVSSFMPDGEPLRVCHGDDLMYIFKRPVTFPRGIPNVDEKTIIVRWVRLISNFAATGNPIPKVTQLLPELWLPLTNTKPFLFMLIGSQIMMKEADVLNKRLEFWESVMTSVLQQPRKTRRDEL